MSVTTAPLPTADATCFVDWVRMPRHSREARLEALGLAVGVARRPHTLVNERVSRHHQPVRIELYPAPVRPPGGCCRATHVLR